MYSKCVGRVDFSSRCSASNHLRNGKSIRWYNRFVKARNKFGKGDLYGTYILISLVLLKTLPKYS